MLPKFAHSMCASLCVRAYFSTGWPSMRPGADDTFVHTRVHPFMYTQHTINSNIIYKRPTQ